MVSVLTAIAVYRWFELCLVKPDFKFMKNIKTAEVHIVSKHINSTEKKSPILTYISCFRTLDINVSKSSINEGKKTRDSHGYMYLLMHCLV